MSLYNFLPGVVTTLKDRSHASKTFVDGNMRLSPKSSFLYHVFLEPTDDKLLPTDRLIETGMMVKNVNLPKFTIDNKAHNSYNRTVLIQSKIKYDPVTITFHDDMADVVRDLWFEYYKHYYNDALYEESIYNAPHLYRGTRQSSNWGFQPESGNPFFRTIRIYQMYQKRFTEYVLINPIITSMQHGQQQAGSSDPVETTMTFAYESVKYYTGTVSTNTILGFGSFHYDTAPSPLSNEYQSTSLENKIRELAASGDTAADFLEGLNQELLNLKKDLSGDGSDQSFLNTVYSLGAKTGNNFSPTGSATNFLEELTSKNPNSTVHFPNIDDYGI